MDLVKRAREADENSPQRIAGSRIFCELADRIEADAKRIAELALDTLAAGMRADEAFQAQLAADARVKALEGLLINVRHLLGEHRGVGGACKLIDAALEAERGKP